MVPRVRPFLDDPLRCPQIGHPDADTERAVTLLFHQCGKRAVRVRWLEENNGSLSALNLLPNFSERPEPAVSARSETKSRSLSYRFSHAWNRNPHRAQLAGGVGVDLPGRPPRIGEFALGALQRTLEPFGLKAIWLVLIFDESHTGSAGYTEGLCRLVLGININVLPRPRRLFSVGSYKRLT
jgi:hypothetical protein